MYQNGEYVRGLDTLSGGNSEGSTGNIVPRFFPEYRKAPGGELVVVEMVELLIPGDSKNAPVEKVTKRHMDLWPRHYEAFKKKEDIVDEGTPIEAWGAIDAGAARALRAMSIMTVEQLAEISDAAVGNIMGGRTLRDRAQQFVKLQAENAETNKLAAEFQAMRSENQRLEQQIADLAGRLQASEERAQEQGAAESGPSAPSPGVSEEPAPKRRGRPPKKAA